MYKLVGIRHRHACALRLVSAVAHPCILSIFLPHQSTHKHARTHDTQIAHNIINNRCTLLFFLYTKPYGANATLILSATTTTKTTIIIVIEEKARNPPRFKWPSVKANVHTYSIYTIIYSSQSIESKSTSQRRTIDANLGILC